MADRNSNPESTMSAATRRTAVTLALAFAVIALYGAGSAQAAVGIKSFSITPSTTQAGGHPDVEIAASWFNRTNDPKNPCRCDDARVISTHFPTGFIGNPHAARTCTFAQFSLVACPSDSQIGAVDPGFGFGYLPVYNMETHPYQAGLVGFIIPLVTAPEMIELSARTDSDYGLDATTSPIFHLLAVPYFKLYLWGVPADPVHDSARFKSPFAQNSFGMCQAQYPQECAEMTGVSSNLSPTPYLENPTSCGTPLTSGLDLQWYSGDERSTTASYPPTTGCDLLAFNPDLTAQPTTATADAASGLDVDLQVPQNLNPSTPAPSEIKATTVSLPEGFSINPNAADGKVFCSQEQGAFGTVLAAQCPEHSKIGTAELDSSALPTPIPGAIYLGEPKPGDKYRIFLTADGYGTHVKLAGSVVPDPRNGRLSVEFPDLPQSPFSEFDLHFFGSERGLLATPSQCGTYEVNTEFVPWDSALPNQHTASFFKITSGPEDKPCPTGKRPFSPQAVAGVTDNTAGRHAPFVVRVSRSDGEQNLSGLDVSPPAGLLAKLSGVSYCSEAALAMLGSSAHTGLAEQMAPACPASSHIGSAWVEAGAGTHPLTTKGEVYLAGPYKGAPLSIVVDVPAVSGPYDLGNVVVRSPVTVDPSNARIATASDAIPQILDGIPLRLRSILIQLDRPNFTVNPTDCSPKSVRSDVHGSEGGAAEVLTHFQTSTCATLDFAPKFSLKLRGGMKRAQNPALRAVVTAGPGEANIGRAALALPASEFLDNDHIEDVCTRVRYAAGKCPPGSVYGHATVASPLLDQPLSGPVYLRSSSHGLPDLVAALHGQIDIELVGRIDSIDGGIRTTFASLPDAPISKFVLEMEGGDKSLLENTRNLCASTGRADLEMRGQNGLGLSRKIKPQVSCGKGSKRKSARRRDGGSR